MSDQAHTPTDAGASTEVHAAQQPGAGTAGTGATLPPPDPGPAAPGRTTYDAAPGGGGGSPMDRPEVQLGAAFAGGFLAALILKRLVS